jgi:hypothetical protein
MALQIRGYVEIFPDKVYESAEAEEIEMVEQGKSLGKIGITKALIIGRYREPTERDVVSYIFEKAESMQAAAASVSTMTDADLDDYSLLEQSLLRIAAASPDIWNHLSTKNPDMAGYLAQNTVAMRSQDHQQAPEFFKIKYGLLPRDVLQENREDGNIDNPAWYYLAFNPAQYKDVRGLGEHFEIKIIVEDDRIIPKDEMDVLLKHGMHQGDGFYVSRTPFPRAAVPVIEAVYRSMPDEKVPFEAEQNLYEAAREHYSLQPVNSLISRLIALRQRQAKQSQAVGPRTSEGGIILPGP